MSAYVVGKDTIDRVVYLITEAERRPYGRIVPDSDIAFELFEIGMTEDRKDVLGRKLWALNVLAVDTRYPAHESATDARIVGYTYQGPKSQLMARSLDGMIQLYKSLYCLFYQCSEDRAIKTDLYKGMERVRLLIGDAIVTKLPAWETSEWA